VAKSKRLGGKGVLAAEDQTPGSPLLLALENVVGPIEELRSLKLLVDIVVPALPIPMLSEMLHSMIWPVLEVCTSKTGDGRLKFVIEVSPLENEYWLGERLPLKLSPSAEATVNSPVTESCPENAGPLKVLNGFPA
jgi:hypothetical protein